ncbi:hypothetical protein E4K72_03860 [Oxalobacteraceae bacterium OM1]|nr:hypothetical protein E4K72_03860 [Oxalobacteraceae bacterium OM1]
MATDDLNASAPYSPERLRRLLSELDQELATTPPDTPHRDALRQEIAAVRTSLDAPGGDPTRVREDLSGLRGRLHLASERIEGEILKDSPYLAELGRIIGLM